MNVPRTALAALSPAGWRARLMIFPYHRVLERHDPLAPGSPDVRRFERQLARIRKFCTPLALSEAISRLRSGTLPRSAVAITFDDGYLNNLDVAAPLLKKYDLPATLFVAVDALERGIMWNDLIIEAVRSATREIDAAPAGLGVLQISASSKLQAIQTLIASIQYMPPAERIDVAEAIYYSVATRPPERLMLNPKQLKDLPAYNFEIGAHTVSHPILRILDDDEARLEIARSRDWIEDVTGIRPTLFAYPNGKRGFDYDERHADMVRSLGFAGAVSANWGCATRKSSIYELPRFKPWEDSDLGFATRLCKVVACTYVSRRR